MAWSEILIILFVALILINPKDLPKIIRAYRKFKQKLIQIKNDVSSIITLTAHNQEIMELEKLLKSKKVIEEKDLKMIYDIIDDKDSLDNIMPDINDQETKNTIH
ncbi:MAG: twin-arginine translocase TatA/TatE family subunit [Alphaproteobacteria bacterium]